MTRRWTTLRPWSPLAAALAAAWRGGADLLWPARRACTLCGVPAGPDPLPICPACLAGAAFPAGLPLCPRCSRPLDGNWALCPECAAGGVPFGSVTALGLYQPPLSHAVTRLKYHGQPALARPLGRALAGALARRAVAAGGDGPAFDAAVPVPLHPGRLRSRGYNQAQCLAAALAAPLRVPVRPGWLRRTRPTAAQARLSRRPRLDNLAGAFAAAPGVRGARILLVDDVLTTGATITAAAAALLAAGAARVDAAVVAVSPRPVW